MPPKRPSPKPTAPPDEVSITDEWGIYDPDKAGMPALFARLGRPILRAGPASARRERRRALRPERSSEGVGLAIAEARKRAGLDVGDDKRVEHKYAAGNPARAMRLALRAQAAVNALGTPAAEPFVAPPQPPPPAPIEREAVPAAEVPLQAATQPPRKRTRKAPARAAAGAGTQDAAAVESTTGDQPRRVRARKKAGKNTARPAAEPAEPASTASARAAASEQAHVPPAPSPRRPRGPVPLAAWAHAVADTPVRQVRSTDKRGFWRSLFRIPPEVALVEYAHGARIHRLLIETGDDQLLDFI